MNLLCPVRMHPINSFVLVNDWQGLRLWPGDIERSRVPDSVSRTALHKFTSDILIQCFCRNFIRHVCHFTLRYIFSEALHTWAVIGLQFSGKCTVQTYCQPSTNHRNIGYTICYRATQATKWLLNSLSKQVYDVSHCRLKHPHMTFIGLCQYLRGHLEMTICLFSVLSCIWLNVCAML